MFTPPELIDLFAKLASFSNTTSSYEDEALNDAISKLSICLNVEGQEDDSRVRVLDAALSLLSFKSPQVCDSAVGFTVKTIIELLSSLVSCRVVTVTTLADEVLVVGSMMSTFDSLQVVEGCSDVIGDLEKQGLLSEMRKIVYGVVKLVVSTPCYWNMLPSNVVIDDLRSVSGKSKALTKLQRCFPKDLQQDTTNIPLRLLWWFLDPLLLKKDVLIFLEEALNRPFLCLNQAFRERADWRSIITCLTISPAMFIEVRGLLHHWFLQTGLDVVQELLSELISGILDITSQPNRWGLMAETGLRLPFSNAYFPYNLSLVRNFMEPLSTKGVEKIVCMIHKHIALDKQNHLNPSLKGAGKYSERIDEKSSWALAMNFPEWFYYSCILLFSGDGFEDNNPLECTSSAQERAVSIDKAQDSFAIKYIAWVLCPINQSHQLALCDILSNISTSWTLNQAGRSMEHKDASGSRKKLKKVKCTEVKDIDKSSVMSCLNRFQSAFFRLTGETHLCPIPSQGISRHDHRNLLYCRVPLGILIGNPNDIDDQDCEYIMHYAITGAVLRQETRSVISQDEAIAGIHLAFRLVELGEKVFNSVFNSEQSAIKCTNRVKLRVGKYLLKCIKRLLEHNFDDSGCSTLLMDIRNRLIQWRQPGPELPVRSEELDDILSELNCRLASL